MTIAEQIAQKAQQLSPQHQQQALDFIEFLLEKEQKEKSEHSAWSFSWAGGLKDLHQTAAELKEAMKAPQRIKMSFSWRGCLKTLGQTSLEVQKEILQRRATK